MTLKFLSCIVVLARRALTLLTLRVSFLSGLHMFLREIQTCYILLPCSDVEPVAVAVTVKLGDCNNFKTHLICEEHPLVHRKIHTIFVLFISADTRSDECK